MGVKVTMRELQLAFIFSGMMMRPASTGELLAKRASK